MCYTDGFMMNDRVGARVYIPDMCGTGTSVKMSSHIGENSTVFQAETFTVEQAAKLLKDNGTKNKTMAINCDSRAAMKAVDSSIIKSKTTQKPLMSCTHLARSTPS